jgi:hypothetical protein
LCCTPGDEQHKDLLLFFNVLKGIRTDRSPD